MNPPRLGTYWQYVEHWARVDPDFPALREGDRVVTSGELLASTDRLAKALLGMGIVRGDRIVTILPSSIEYVFTLVAAGKVGAIVVPLDVKFRSADLERFLSHAQPKLIIAVPTSGDDDITEVLRSLGSAYDPTPKVLVGSHDFDQAFEDLVSSELPLDRELEEAAWQQGPDDGALVVFTGGTTGVPKAALLSHRNMTLMSYLDVVHLMGGTLASPAREKMAAPLPPSHVGGTVEFIGSGLVGGNEMIMMESWSPHEVLAATEREKLRWIGGVPTMFAILLAMPDLDRYDLSSVELAICSGEKVPLELLEGIRARIAPNVIVGYGTTEAGAEVTLTVPGDDPVKISEGYGGRPLPTVRIRIEDEDGRPLRQGEVGEIVTGGPLGIRSYYNMPEEDAAGFTADGWVKTGDLGYLDEEGGLYIVGRKKHIIRVGSYTVVPSEVEEVALGVPGVGVAAAVGAPDPILFERVWLFVSPDEGATLDESTVLATCRERLADFKVPAKVVIRDQLPTSRIGKVERKALEEMAKQLLETDDN
jgi:acyl-CoA synthetase (AMP-forming)/AMP-acid ligase II